MRSMVRSLIVTGAAVAAVGLAGISSPTATGADGGAETSSRPTPAGSNTDALRLGRRKIGEATPLQTVKQRKPTAVTPASAETPPVPGSTDGSADLQPTPEANSEPQPFPGVQRSGTAVMPGGGQVPISPRFSGPNAFHERLRAKRIARLEQMRRNAEANGDKQGAQRAEFLEGAVNQMHNQGLFNFAQKVMGAFQSGELSLDKLKSGGAQAASSASGSSVEMPDADLGEAAPLSAGSAPEVDLGEAAPLPTDDAPAAKPNQPEPPPTLPPPSDK